MSTTSSQRNLQLLLEELDIPDSAYERAERRYQDLGEFFGSADARCAAHAPHIYPQGSFRLGTVVRPIGEDEYDLDVGLRLHQGLSKSNTTQEQLKQLVGRDLVTYRTRRGIQQGLSEKRRCWRLAYRDELAFHMDVVPSLPEEGARRAVLQERMQSTGVDAALSARVAQHAGAITDNQHAHYSVLSDDWKVSNSEGYALWFESRLRQAQVLLEKSAAARGTTIDRLPMRAWESPLQTAIRVLKRHRDQMYQQHPDAKPISVIITTLAALAYRGEIDLESTLDGVLERMSAQVRATRPRVPNPVNPEEDFADKWYEPAYAALRLEDNFHAWLQRARADLHNLRYADSETLLEGALDRFGVEVGRDRLAKALGAAASRPSQPSPLAEPTIKPWA